MSYEQRARVDTPDGRRSSDADFVDGFVAVYVDHEPWKDAARKQLSERLASIAAEAREQAIKGCCAAAEALREGPNTPTIGALVETMRRTIDTPRPDLRLVAREDLAKVIEAAETFVNNSSLVCVEIRKAINRLRAGEE
jgi:hypothetical protein